MMKKKKIKMAVFVAIFMTMTICLNCATFADFTIGTKICFGIAAAILYGVINLIPYFLTRKNKTSKI